MNSNLLKKLLAVAMTGLFLISMGASAVGVSAVGATTTAVTDTPTKCKHRGGKWESTPKPAHCSVKPQQ